MVQGKRKGLLKKKVPFGEAQHKILPEGGKS